MQRLEPAVDRLEWDRREVGGIDPDMELRSVRAERAIVRVPVQQGQAGIDRSMGAVPLDPGRIAGVWIVRGEDRPTTSCAGDDLGEHGPPRLFVHRQEPLDGACGLRRR